MTSYQEDRTPPRPDSFNFIGMKTNGAYADPTSYLSSQRTRDATSSIDGFHNASERTANPAAAKHAALGLRGGAGSAKGVKVPRKSSGKHSRRSSSLSSRSTNDGSGSSYTDTDGSSYYTGSSYTGSSRSSSSSTIRARSSSRNRKNRPRSHSRRRSRSKSGHLQPPAIGGKAPNGSPGGLQPPAGWGKAPGGSRSRSRGKHGSRSRYGSKSKEPDSSKDSTLGSNHISDGRSSSRSGRRRKRGGVRSKPGLSPISESRSRSRTPTPIAGTNLHNGGRGQPAIILNGGGRLPVPRGSKHTKSSRSRRSSSRGSHFPVTTAPTSHGSGSKNGGGVPGGGLALPSGRPHNGGPQNGGNKHGSSSKNGSSLSTATSADIGNKGVFGGPSVAGSSPPPYTRNPLPTDPWPQFNQANNNVALRIRGGSGSKKVKRPTWEETRQQYQTEGAEKFAGGIFGQEAQIHKLYKLKDQRMWNTTGQYDWGSGVRKGVVKKKKGQAHSDGTRHLINCKC